MASSINDLYALDPNEFVPARDQLARELRAAGDKRAAADVKGRRRPSVPVWALNQVSRTQPDAVEALLDAMHEARNAHDDTIGGGRAATLRAALTARRQAMRAVARAAREVVDRSGRSGASQERDIEDALAAIVDDSDAIDALRRGELAAAPTGDGADDLLGALAASVPLSVDREDEVEPEPEGPSPELVAAREVLGRRRAEAEEAHARADRADHAVAEAQAVVDGLEA
jgi:hypothetical protein